MTFSPQAAGDDRGLSLVEIMIALFLLAAISLILVPAFIQSISHSTANATNATANQLANLEQEAADAATTCTALQSYASTATSTITDSHGVLLKAYRSVVRNPASPAPTPTPTGSFTACSSTDTYPETVSVTVTVKRSDTGATLSSVTGLLFLASYST